MKACPVILGLLLCIVSAQLSATGSIEMRPELDIRKSAGSVELDPDGSYRVAIRIEVCNSGAVKLYDLQIVDDIARQLAPARVVRIEHLKLKGDLRQLNRGFDGVTDVDLLSGKEWLKPGGRAVISFILVFDAHGELGPFHNLATGHAVDAAGEEVIDKCSRSAGRGAACKPASIKLPVMPVNPVIGLSKTATAARFVETGAFETLLKFRVENFGAAGLEDVQVIDDLTAVFGPDAAFEVVQGTLFARGLTANPGFNGSSDTRLLTGSDTLFEGASGEVEVAVRFFTDAPSGVFFNQAHAFAIEAQDDSTNGPHPDPGGDGAPEEDEPTPIPFKAPPPAAPEPVVGLAVTAADSVALPSVEFQTTLSFLVENLGEVEVDALEIDNDLTAAFVGTANFQVVPDSLAGSGLVVDPAFDGRAHTNLLAAGNRLSPGATARLSFTVIFDPGEERSPFFTQATLRATDPLEGVEVTDISTSGADPDPDGDGNPAESQPTVISFDRDALGTAALSIGKIVESIEPFDDGFQIDFLIRAENVGALRIDHVQVTDDLRKAFPEPTDVIVTASPMVRGSLSEVNAGFGVGSSALLSGAESLAPGELADIRFSVRVVLNGAAGPFTNQALGTGTDPQGRPVMDPSDDDLDPDDESDPGGGDDSTPIEIPAGISGTLFIDENHNRKLDGGDLPASGWRVLIESSDADAPVEAMVDDSGAFEVVEVPPGEVLLRFVNPDNGVEWARTLVQIEPNTRPQIEALVDAQGIVYESGRRVPLPGVVLSLANAAGDPLPAVCLLPGQWNQSVDDRGAYRFDIQFGADPVCPDETAEFQVKILEVPQGFSAEISSDLPPLTEPLRLDDCAVDLDLPCVVQDQSTAPLGADRTDYYLQLLWGPGVAGMANNHIPIDRPAEPAPGGEILVQHFTERSRASIGDVVGYRVVVQNISDGSLAGVATEVEPPAGLPVIDDSLVLVRAGPDGELNTPDDIVSRLPVVDPRGFEVPIGPLNAAEIVEARYAARVSPGVTPGIKVSKATGSVASGVGDSATASLRIEADPLLAKTTIIGKVFHDLNNDGVQQNCSGGPADCVEEPGIPGVRLATLEGLLVETDSAGRYHIADVDTGRADRGANFMIKLDANSLPEEMDARRSERQVVRLTPGLMTRINFPVRTLIPGTDHPSVDDRETGAPVSIEKWREARSDQLRGEPRLDVLAIPKVLVRSDDATQTLQFAVYSNYGLFIRSYQIALYDVTDPRFARPIQPPSPLFLEPVNGLLDLQIGEVEVTLPAGVQKIGYRLIALGTCSPDDNLPTRSMLKLLEGDSSNFDQADSSRMAPALPFDRTRLRLLEVRDQRVVEASEAEVSEVEGREAKAWEIFGRSSLELQNIPIRGYQTVQRRQGGERGIVVDIEPIPIPIGSRAAELRGDLEATYGLIGADGLVSDVRPLPIHSETWAVFDHEGLVPGRAGIVEFDPNRSVGSIKKDLPVADSAGARGLHRTIMECGCTLMAADTIIDDQSKSLSLRLTNLSEQTETPELIFDASRDGRLLRKMLPRSTQEVFLGAFDSGGYRSSHDWRSLRIRFSTATAAGYVPEFRLERAGSVEPSIRASCDSVSARPDTTRADNLLAAMIVEAEAEPPPDTMFAMGLINLTVGDNDVSGNVEALSDDDHYDESVFVDGRVAGYLRGKIRGRYLVTAQFDTSEDELKNLGDNLNRKDPQRIFRQLDPDRYYPVYGDDSTTTSDVDSQGAMYLRVDWDESTGLWGNYNTGFTDTEFAQYNRSLYGAKLDFRSVGTNRYGENTRSLKVFGSEAQTQSAHASFRATGGSLYYLPHRDIVQGSEKLRVEVRARDSEQVLDTEILLPGRDYEIDDIQGRILLARPLSQVVRERSNTIVRSMPLEGDRVFLLADYEHVPSDFSADDLTTGVRARWMTDTLGLGVSRVDDQRDGRNYSLTGTDVRWRLSENSFIGGEFARSEARQNDINTLSFDGGLTFDDERLPVESDALDGDAWGLEAQFDLAEFSDDREGSARLWHKERQAGFSSGRLGESGEVIDSGFSADVRLNEAAIVSTSANRVERELGLDETVVRAQTDIQLGCEGSLGCIDLGLEGRYEDLQSNTPGNSLIEGDALLAGARVGKALNDTTTVYSAMQTVVEHSDGYEDNDLVSVGVNRTLSERIAVSLEASEGDRGDALVGGIDYVRENGTALNLSGGVGSGATTQFGSRYALSEGNELYGTYTVNPDRTDGARNMLTLGQRRQAGGSVDVFTETTFGRDDGYADSAHVFGLDYQADQDWLISARLQASDLEREGVDVERQVASVGASYQKDGTRVASRLEARRDRSYGLDTWQYLTSNLFGLKNEAGDQSWIGKLNLAWTDNEAADIDDGRFVEFDIGFALRPIAHDEINALAKYSFLYDLGSSGQLGPNGRSPDQLEERSHVLSAEVLYDVSGVKTGGIDLDGVELGAKIAGKFGEQRVFESGDWYDTKLAFASVRARYRLIGAADDTRKLRWEALTEYRMLKDFEDDGVRHGALVGIYLVKPTDQGQFRVGVGYNFTDFDSDLRRDDYRSGGWFLDVSAAY